jgi:hypothetical protein
VSQLSSGRIQRSSTWNPPDQLALNREEEKENIIAFVEQSRRFSEEFAAQENPENESVGMMCLLPKKL